MEQSAVPSLANNLPKPPGVFPTPSHLLILFARITESRQAVRTRGLLILDPSPAKTLEINKRKTTSAVPASLFGYKRKTRQFWCYLQGTEYLYLSLWMVDGRGQPSANPLHAGVNQRGLHALKDSVDSA